MGKWPRSGLFGGVSAALFANAPATSVAGANRPHANKGSVSRSFIHLPFDVQCGQTDKRAQSLDESPSATTGLARILATSLDAALRLREPIGHHCAQIPRPVLARVNDKPL